VGINQLELAYAYVRCNTSIDPSIIVSGAKFNLSQGRIDYTRYFTFLHRTASLSLIFWYKVCRAFHALTCRNSPLYELTVLGTGIL